MPKRRYKVALLEPTPNWHRPELYSQLGSHERIDLMVYYCSDEALNGKVLTEAFAATGMSWGQNLVEGYNHTFVKNRSLVKPKFNTTRPFSYFNPGIWNEIRKGEYDALVIAMWNDVTPWIAAMAGRVSKIPLMFLGDSTVLTEAERPNWVRKIKKILLGKLLFPFGAAFLYRDEANRQFFQQYGVPEERLFFYPYSVDFEKYSAMYHAQKTRREAIRQEHGIDKDAYVILFVGRLSDVKRPMDLLKAFECVRVKKKVLIYVGDGNLRDALETYIHDHEISGVYLTGFKQKSEVLWYYLMADVFVLPSGFEPHGHVVNEALCFGLPIIVSDKVGAAGDLAKQDENGFVYPSGDTLRLAQYLDALSDKARRVRFGQRSLEIIKDWDHGKAVAGLLGTLDKLHEEG